MATSVSRYVADRQYAGSFANTVLYRLCEEHPRHKDVGIVAAKIGLISRYYSASPKRGIGADRNGDNVSFFDQFADYLCGTALDLWLSDVRDAGAVSEENLDLIVGAHSDFESATADFINNVWGLGTGNRRAVNRRSFASKYLHFHAPEAFPLYDSVILSRLGLGVGTNYRRFCERCLVEAKQRYEKGNWTPRLLDKDLYPYEAV